MVSELSLDNTLPLFWPEHQKIVEITNFDSFSAETWVK